MTKTPEQMAEEYVKTILAVGGKDSIKIDFLAGYQAAKNELADADKVMNSPKKLDSWISVKERLPEFTHLVNENKDGYTNDVLMLFADGRIDVLEFERRDGVVKTGHGNDLNIVSHWMPLPAAPKEEG